MFRFYHIIQECDHHKTFRPLHHYKLRFYDARALKILLEILFGNFNQGQFHSAYDYF